MSLLGSIAAALSDGVGGGMLQNAKWGEEKAAQAKKEAAEDARLKEQLNRYDLDRQSRDKYYAGLLEESKNERLSRAEQAKLDRENDLRIANIRASSGGSGGGRGSAADARASLEMLDKTIRGIDAERARLAGKLEGADASTAKEIQVSIDALSSQRENLLNSNDANNIWAANGEIGRAHRAQFFANTKDEKAESSSTPPESLVIPPPRAVVKPGDGGLLNKMSANQNGYTGSKPNYPNSSYFTNPQVNDSDVTSKYLYRQGGTTAADAANAVSKLGYHLPSAY